MADSNPIDNPENKDSVDSSALPDDASSAEDIANEIEEEEFSLEQLSAAYAQVLKSTSATSVADRDEISDADAIAVSDQFENRQKVEKKSSRTADEQVETEKIPVVDDDAACPISPASILESILFVGGPADVKLTSRKIAAVMRDVSPKEITALAKELNKNYEAEQRAYRVVSEKGSLKMELHPDMIPVQNHILGRDRATKLTQQAIDVLAVVAYNQPVTREQVDQIRAKSSGSILNQMLKRDLLQLEVTESTPKMKLFRTTDRFLDLFCLDAIDDLPQSHDVSDFEELAD